jgi:hypothetical protein
MWTWAGPNFPDCAPAVTGIRIVIAKALRYPHPFAIALRGRPQRLSILSRDEASITAASRWMNSDIDFDQYRMGESGVLVRSIHSALAVAAVASMMTIGGVALAQQATVPAAGPSVKDPAPDFTVGGATRYGLLKTPVTLSDFRGRTVVLAFFYQARTKG